MTKEIKFLVDSINELKDEVSQLRNTNYPLSKDELMTRQEVANFFKIDLSTLHHWTKKGKLTRYGLGKRIYFKRSEIEQALVELEPLNH
ncbi:helix-turn-helix domain-containing protein [Christiangramia aquimixticola]|uniref:helix-turn-helix domain-containing protein n=1 Tax=Christiangramia aquimixticola TaxID=1697558 RepID=UPI003AA7C2B8